MKCIPIIQAKEATARFPMVKPVSLSILPIRSLIAPANGSMFTTPLLKLERTSPVNASTMFARLQMPQLAQSEQAARVDSVLLVACVWLLVFQAPSVLLCKLIVAQT
jgi:hypothetical protein